LPATIADPTRPDSGLPATVSTAVPLPTPDAPALTVIKLSALVAVHAQFTPLDAVTSIETSAPAAVTVAASGVTVNWQACAVVPFWTIVSEWPPTSTVPWRAAPLLLCTVNLTDPDPVPEAAPEIVMNTALLEADHAHPVAVLIATVNSPPAASIDCDGPSPTLSVQLVGVDAGTGVGFVGFLSHAATASATTREIAIRPDPRIVTSMDPPR
jgi:hypothetical protein